MADLSSRLPEASGDQRGWSAALSQLPWADSRRVTIFPASVMVAVVDGVAEMLLPAFPWHLTVAAVPVSFDGSAGDHAGSVCCI